MMGYLPISTIQKIGIIVKCVILAGFVTACGGSGSFGVSKDGQTVFIDAGS